MAVRFDGTTESLRRTTNFPTWSSFTVCFWLMITSDINDFNNLFYWGDNGFNDGFWIGTDSDGVTLRVDNWPSGLRNYAVLTVGAWNHIAVVNSGTTITPYINGVAQTTITSSQAPSNTQWGFGGVDTSGTPISNSRMFAGKVFSRALSAADILQEMSVGRVVNPTSIHGHYPMFAGSGERGRDYSGNGYDLSENGTLSDEAPPPVSWGGVGWMLPPEEGAAGFVTYTKTGGAISTGQASGADSNVFIETAGAQSPGQLAGADANVFIETAGVQSPGVVSSTDNTVFVETGGAKSPGGPASLTDLTVYVETATAAAPGVITGADSNVFVETATATATAGASGQSGTSVTYTKTGGVTACGEIGSTDSVVFVETAGAESPGAISGADVRIWVETAGVQSPGVISGASTYTPGAGATVYTKTGGIESPGVVSSTDNVLFNRTGGVESPAAAFADLISGAARGGKGAQGGRIIPLGYDGLDVETVIQRGQPRAELTAAQAQALLDDEDLLLILMGV